MKELVLLVWDDSLGDFQKAIGFLGKALVIFKSMLGDEHPNVQNTERIISIIKSQQKLY